MWTTPLRCGPTCPGRRGSRSFTGRWGRSVLPLAVGVAIFPAWGLLAQFSPRASPGRYPHAPLVCPAGHRADRAGVGSGATPGVPPRNARSPSSGVGAALGSAFLRGHPRIVPLPASRRRLPAGGGAVFGGLRFAPGGECAPQVDTKPTSHPLPRPRRSAQRMPVRPPSADVPPAPAPKAQRHPRGGFAPAAVAPRRWAEGVAPTCTGGGGGKHPAPPGAGTPAAGKPPTYRCGLPATASGGVGGEGGAGGAAGVGPGGQCRQGGDRQQDRPRCAQQPRTRRGDL